MYGKLKGMLEAEIAGMKENGTSKVEWVRTSMVQSHYEK